MLVVAICHSGVVEGAVFECDPTDPTLTTPAVADDLNSDDAGFAECIAMMTAGDRLIIPDGTFDFSAELVIDVRMRIQTPGLGNGSPHTVLKFAQNVNGLRLETNVQVDPIWIIGDASSTAAVHGIWMEAGSSLFHPYVKWFSGDGIHIEGHTSNGTITNGWLVEGGASLENGGHGVYVDGDNANAGMAIRVYAADNGGWGFYDSSFLGNRYFAVAADGNDEGALRVEGSGNRTTFYDPYIEGGTPPTGKVLVDAAAKVLGGNIGVADSAGNPPASGGYVDESSLDGDPASTGSILIGGVAYSGTWSFQNRANPTEPVGIRLGHNTVSAAVLQIDDPAIPSQPYRLTHGVPSTGFIGMQKASSSSLVPFYFNSNSFGAVQMYLGPTSNKKLHFNTSGAPTSACSSGERGYVAWEVLPVPGGWVGYICTNSGWKGFGAIEP